MSTYSSLDSKKNYNHQSTNDINTNNNNQNVALNRSNDFNNKQITKYVTTNNNNNKSIIKKESSLPENLLYFSNLLKSCNLSVSHSAILNDLCH
jgi:hypothetical protein